MFSKGHSSATQASGVPRAVVVYIVRDCIIGFVHTRKMGLLASTCHDNDVLTANGVTALLCTACPHINRAD